MHQWSFIILAGLLARLVTPSLLYGQFLESPSEAKISFERFSVAQGFYGWRANGAVQDLNGYIWIASRNGLYRFDGYDLVEWVSDRTDSSTHFTSWTGHGFIEIDRNGLIWLGEYDGLERFDPVTHQVVRYQHDPEDASTLSSNAVFSFLLDSKGRYWIGTYRGLDLFDPETGTFQHIIHQPGAATGLPRGAVRKLMEDRDGHIWIGTVIYTEDISAVEPTFSESALSKFNPETGAFHQYIYSSTHGDSGDRVSALLEDRKGRIWIGTQGVDGLYRYNPDTDVIEHLAYDPATPDQVSAPRKRQLSVANNERLGSGINFLHEDQEGHIWIGDFLAGVDRYNPETGERLHFEYDASDPESPFLDQVIDILETREGTKWIFTWNGILKVIDQKPRFRHFMIDLADIASAKDWEITALNFDSKGNMWLGTLGNGIKQYDRETGEVTHYHSKRERFKRLSYDFGLDIYERASEPDIIWIGTLAGLNRLDLTTGEIENFRHNPSGRVILTREGVAPMLEDVNGGLWIGGWGGGLRYCMLDENHCVRYRPSAKADSLGDGLITFLYQDSDETLWIGTRDAGLYEYRVDAAGNSKFIPHISRRVTVTSIYETADNHLWVGTNNGLYRHGTNHKWQRFTKDDGLPDNTICHILPNGDAELWLSTHAGISLLKLDDMTFRNFIGEDRLEKMYVLQIQQQKTIRARSISQGIMAISPLIQKPQSRTITAFRRRSSSKMSFLVIQYLLLNLFDLQPRMSLLSGPEKIS